MHTELAMVCESRPHESLYRPVELQELAVLFPIREG